MAQLAIRLLGGFAVTLDGEPVTGFDSNKVRALLAYLAVEADRAHRRDALAALLWPDYPDGSARTNLRNALANLRSAIGDRHADPPFLWITRDTLQFNVDSDVFVDVAVLQDAASDPNGLPIEALTAASDVYAGDFLAGFSPADALPFDDWARATRGRLLRRTLDLLGTMADRLAEDGRVDDALAHAQRRVDLAPWFETAHRQCIRLLAAAGRRSAALRQYEICVAVLERELDAEPSAQTLALYDELREQVSPPTTAEPAPLLPAERRDVGPCPYRGLAPFREADATLFFGRNAFVAQLGAALSGPHPLTAVVGPSGSGKSSVVGAGLLPQLRQSDAWLIVSLRPGADPYHALAGALTPHLSPEADAIEQLAQARRLAALLARSELPVADVVQRVLDQQPDRCRLLLLVDQFEELYTLCPVDDTRRGFIDLLLGAAAMPGRDTAILLTLRADFMGQALAYRPFADALQHGSQMLGPMTRAELRSAIEKPAAAHGAVFERGLVSRLLDDVGHEPGNLPLLEFALSLLWEHLDNGWITHTAYQRIGRVQGALAQYAQYVFDTLSEDDQPATRRVFTQLVQPGDGTEDTRRIATRADVTGPAGSGDETWTLVSHLADRRLVVTGRDNITGAETVEVIHEALIQHWEQLQTWMEEDRAFRTWQERLRVSLRTWEATDHDEGALLRGVPLAEAEQWLADLGEALSLGELAFIEACLDLRDRRATERAEARERELEAARRLAEAHDRAIREREEALRQAAIGLATEVRSLMQGPEQDLAPLVALEAVQRYPYTWQAELALADVVLDWRIDMQFDHGVPVTNAAQVSPDGTRILTAANDGMLRVWDLATHENLLTLRAYRGLSANFHLGYWSPSGDRILTSCLAGGQPKVWDGTTGAMIAECATDGGCHAVWSPDGTRLLSQWENEIAAIWDAQTGERIHTLPVSRGVRAAFSPDGQWVSTSEGTIFDAGNGDLRSRLAGFERFAGERGELQLRWSPDSEMVGTGARGEAHIWDVETGERLLALRTGYRGLADLSWSPTGDRVLVTGRSGNSSQAALWEADSGEKLRELPFYGGRSHAGEPWAPGGDRVLLADDQGSVAICDADSGRVVLRVDAHEGEAEASWLPSGNGFATVGCMSGRLKVWTTSTAAVDFHCGPDCPQGGWTGPNAAVWSPDGTRIARPYDDGSVRVWDVGSGAEIARTHRGSGTEGLAVNHVAWSPAGGRLLTGAGDGGVEIWDATTGACLLALEGHGSVAEDGFWSLNHVVCGVAWSPDGRRALTCGRDRRAVVWDTETGEALRIYAGREYHWGAWSPDSTRIALVDMFGYGGPARIWDVETGDALVTLLSDDFAHGSSAVDWSPDGTQIVTFSLDDVGRVWDAESGTLQGTFKTRGFCVLAQWSPSGRRILCGGDNGVRVWDATTLRQVAAYPAGTGAGSNCGTWSPDGTAIAIGRPDGDVRVSPAWESLEDLVAYAKEHCVLRELTAEERVRFGLPPMEPSP